MADEKDIRDGSVSLMEEEREQAKKKGGHKQEDNPDEFANDLKRSKEAQRKDGQ